MSVVHIMLEGDWMRIPLPEVRRVRLVKYLEPSPAGLAQPAQPPTVSLRLSVYILSNASIGELNITFPLTPGVDHDPTSSVAHQMRDDLFFCDIEQDITWTNTTTGWDRKVGRPENQNPDYRKNE